MLIFLFILGLAVLSLGAELFVRGASRLAALAGISPLIIGLTVVAFGTSAPEVAVVVQAGFQGQDELAFGNIVGSNISNFLLILGISALVAPLVVSQRLIQLEVPLLLGISVVVLFLGLDGRIDRFEGMLMFAGAILYTVLIIRESRKENQEASAEQAKDNSQQTTSNPSQTGQKSGWGKNALWMLLGLAGLVLGANWLVDGASGIARLFGVSELVIGLTVVAVGTSLPELATSVMAGLRGERDLAIGNIIGSNLFNLLFVLGIAGAVAPGGLTVPDSSISFDLPVLIAVTAATLPIFFSGYNITRWEGTLFLAYYAAYSLYLFMFGAEHDLLPAYSTIMLQYIIPPTVLLLTFILVRALRSNIKAPQSE